MIGFCGSRVLSPAFAPAVAAVVGGLGPGPAVVGCAPGADFLVRRARPDAQVLRASDYGNGPGAFVARSCAVVRAVAAGGPGSLFVGFVSVPCPAGIVPASAWRSGRPVSGSWSSLALAAGRGVRVGGLLRGWAGVAPGLAGWRVGHGPGGWCGCVVVVGRGCFSAG